MRGRKPKTVSPIAAAINKLADKKNTNPFIIETGHTYAGKGRSANPYTPLLTEQMLKLPADKNLSIPIPLGIASTKQQALNIFLNAKRRIRAAKGNDYYFTMKTVYSVDKKSYLGARIWRLH